MLMALQWIDVSEPLTPERGDCGQCWRYSGLAVERFSAWAPYVSEFQAKPLALGRAALPLVAWTLEMACFFSIHANTNLIDATNQSEKAAESRD